jgi:hypothetical protein
VVTTDMKKISKENEQGGGDRESLERDPHLTE